MITDPELRRQKLGLPHPLPQFLQELILWQSLIVTSCYLGLDWGLSIDKGPIKRSSLGCPSAHLDTLFHGFLQREVVWGLGLFPIQAASSEALLPSQLHLLCPGKWVPQLTSPRGLLLQLSVLHWGLSCAFPKFCPSVSCPCVSLRFWSLSLALKDFCPLSPHFPFSLVSVTQS